MKNESPQDIRIKIAISLNKLLSDSKIISQDIINEENIGISYNEIALNAEMRKATVSDVFNAHKSANTSTLFRIIYAMGYNLSDFSIKYDKITDLEIKNFKVQNKKDA